MNHAITPTSSGSSTPTLVTPWKLFVLSLNLYMANFKPFALLALIGFIPNLCLMIIFITYSLLPKNGEYVVLMIVLGLIGIFALLGIIFVYILCLIGMYLRAEKPSGETVKETLRRARPYLLKYIGTSFLVGIFVVLWSILFVIPGIIYSIFYAFATYVLVFEGVGIRASLKRSKILVKGYWWSVMGRFLFAFIISIGILLPFMIPSIFMAEGSLTANIWQFIQRIIQAFLTPLFVIYGYFMYKELREIKGNDDFVVGK